jgi:hypothetical protein
MPRDDGACLRRQPPFRLVCISPRLGISAVLRRSRSRRTLRRFGESGVCRLGQTATLRAAQLSRLSNYRWADEP